MKGDVWYHIYALGFCGAPYEATAGDVAHRLRRVSRWVDHVADLGATKLLLGPVFQSASHGYDVMDYLAVDARLGDMGDVQDVVDRYGDAGIQVILDVPFNHVSRRFPPFADVLQRRESSSFVDWFDIDFACEGPDGFRYADFEGHQHLVKLNHSNNDILQLAVDVACHWLDVGVAGFRLDAAYAVPNTFWRKFIARVKQRHPDAFFLGEVIHGDYANFVTESSVDSVTQYELYKAIWSSLNDRNFFELRHALERHASWCRMFNPYNFIGNHDVTRIASQLGDETHLSFALAVLFTLPGSPSIYYGDEFAWSGVKYHRAHGDDEVRTAAPDHPPAVAGDDHILALTRELARLRHSVRIAGNDLAILENSNEHIAYVASSETTALVVVLNLSPEWLVMGNPSECRGRRVLAGAASTANDPRALRIPPASWTVVELTT